MEGIFFFNPLFELGYSGKLLFSSPCPRPLWKNGLTRLTIYKNPQQIIVWGYERGATDGAPWSFSVSLLFPTEI